MRASIPPRLGPRLLAAALLVAPLLPCPSVRAAPAPDAEGPQLWSWRTVQIQNDDLDHTFKASVYYPGLAEGRRQELDPSLAPYPAVVFGHGFAMNRKRYDFLGQHLATHGYVVVLMNFKDLVNGHQRSDMRASITWLEDQDADPGSWLHEAVDTESVGVSGHSMGGGVCVQVAGEDPRVGACAPLAPATGGSEVAGVAVPLLILAGDKDGLTPIGDIRDAYEQARPPSALVTVLGGNHNQFMDVSYPWEDIFDGRATITRAEQQRITQAYATAHYGYHLKGEAAYRTFLYGYGGGADPAVSIDATSGEPLDVRVVPASTEVPAGGSLELDVVLENHSADPAPIEGRTLVRRNDVVVWDPLLGPLGATLDPGEVRTVPVAQPVPEGMAGEAGEYVIAVDVGGTSVQDWFPVQVIP